MTRLPRAHDPAGLLKLDPMVQYWLVWANEKARLHWCWPQTAQTLGRYTVVATSHSGPVQGTPPQN